MKKKVLLIFTYLLVFILAGCTPLNNIKAPTSYDLIDSLQLQMNNVVTTVRGLDVLYQEDYVIAPIYNGNYNNVGYGGANYNYGYGYGYNNDDITAQLNNNEHFMRNTDTYGISGYGYNGSNSYSNFYGNYYGTGFNNNYSNNYRYNNSAYENFFGNRYNNFDNNLTSNNGDLFSTNIDTYNTLSTQVSELNTNTDLNSDTTYSVFNDTTTLNNDNLGTYVPKYTTGNGLNRETLNAYVSSLEDLYLITSDINSANYILNSLMMNNIELAVAIRNNAFYLNYNVNALPTDNLQVVSEYVNTIDTILTGLNATYGYITAEIEGIAPLKDTFYNNTEALNARYLKLINVIDSRIAQLQNLMVSLQRLNAQLILVGNQNNQPNLNGYYYPNQYIQHNINQNDNTINNYPITRDLNTPNTDIVPTPNSYKDLNELQDNYTQPPITTNQNETITNTPDIEESLITNNTNILQNDTNILPNASNNNNLPQENTSQIQSNTNDQISNQDCEHDCEGETNIFIEEYNSDTYFDTNRILTETKKIEGSNYPIEG